MSHAPALIQKVLSQIELDWPKPAYRYVIERCIPGTRMHPDIAVYDGKTPVCVVEIGYTRPEKLTAYRDQLGIKDVRWYAKDGSLHTEMERRSVTVTVSIEPSASVAAYSIRSHVPCGECAEEYAYEDGTPDEDYGCEDVITILLVDRPKAAWAACFCDKCGRVWVADEYDLLLVLHDLTAMTPQEFGKAYGAKLGDFTWPDALALIQQSDCQTDIDYTADAIFFGAAKDGQLRHALKVAKVPTSERTDREIP